MTRIISRIVVALIVTIMSGVMSLANDKTGAVTFSRDVKINTTVLNKGTYNIKYDKASNELTISDGAVVVARSKARLAKVSTKISNTDIVWVKQDSTRMLQGITLRGDEEGIILMQDGGDLVASVK